MAQVAVNSGDRDFEVISQMNVESLALLKVQLDEDLNMLQNSLQTLKVAQNKFQESGLCLDKFTPEAQGKPILVPLTNSMYVAGRLADTENVLVDIGTGYFAKKNVEEGQDYFKRKVTYVTEQIEKIQAIGNEKSKKRNSVKMIMDAKVQALVQKEMMNRK